MFFDNNNIENNGNFRVRSFNKRIDYMENQQSTEEPLSQEQLLLEQLINEVTSQLHAAEVGIKLLENAKYRFEINDIKNEIISILNDAERDLEKIKKHNSYAPKNGQPSFQKVHLHDLINSAAQRFNIEIIFLTSEYKNNPIKTNLFALDQILEIIFHHIKNKESSPTAVEIQTTQNKDHSLIEIRHQNTYPIKLSDLKLIEYISKLISKNEQSENNIFLDNSINIRIKNECLD